MRELGVTQLDFRNVLTTRSLPPKYQSLLQSTLNRKYFQPLSVTEICNPIADKLIIKPHINSRCSSSTPPGMVSFNCLPTGEVHAKAVPALTAANETVKLI